MAFDMFHTPDVFPTFQNSLGTGFDLGEIKGTVSKPLTIRQTWNNSGLNPCMLSLDVTSNAVGAYAYSTAPNEIFRIRSGSIAAFSVTVAGINGQPTVRIGSSNNYAPRMYDNLTGAVVFHRPDTGDCVAVGYCNSGPAVTVVASGKMGFTSQSNVYGGNSESDAFFKRKAAATIQLGADAAGVTNQTFTAANRITSDGVGANLTIVAGNGRGAAGGSLILSSWTTAATGTAGTLTTQLTINTSGTTIGATNGTAITGIRHGVSGNMVAGSVTVTDAGCTANTRYFLTAHTLGTITVPTTYYVMTRNAGTSFVIVSANIADTSTIDWVAIEG